MEHGPQTLGCVAQELLRGVQVYRGLRFGTCRGAIQRRESGGKCDRIAGARRARRESRAHRGQNVCARLYVRGGSGSVCVALHLPFAVFLAPVIITDFGIGMNINSAVAFEFGFVLITAGSQIEAAAEIKAEPVGRRRHRQQHGRHSRTGENLLKGVVSHNVLNYLVNSTGKPRTPAMTAEPWYSFNPYLLDDIY